MHPNKGILCRKLIWSLEATGKNVTMKERVFMYYSVCLLMISYHKYKQYIVIECTLSQYIAVLGIHPYLISCVFSSLRLLRHYQNDPIYQTQ